jgi:alpha-L-rhamnosidase
VAGLNVSHVTCEYKQNPIGIDSRKPRFSWRTDSDLRATLQQAYQIQVAGPDGDFSAPLWDTGIRQSDVSVLISYEGPQLKPRTRYFYRVKLWDVHRRESDWSDMAWWETGLLETEEWKAEWITPGLDGLNPLAEEAFYLRKAFAVKNKVERARIYATGAGIYELYLNGSKVGDELLAPGWTSYHERLQYQTYDVTSHITQGENGIGFVLADGWYKGSLGWKNARQHYGDRRAALLQLHVEFEDGSEDLILSDTSWKASTGAVLFAELYHGEIYDARLEQKGWSRADFDDSTWKSVVPIDLPLTTLVAQEGPPVRVTELVQPIAVIETPSGHQVLDMGQNMVGRIRMTVQAPSGTRIVLKHAEVLDKEGDFYTGNLRTARQTVEYIAKGEGEESYAPAFTFQGFRYVLVEGYPVQENGQFIENFVGEVIHSDMEKTGSFECSNPMVNQLQRNIVWGQRGNFVDVPTDCPQRDERLGWTGDAQVFIRTALYNYMGGPFFAKWLRDLKTDQKPNGGVPFVIPDIIADPQMADGHSSAAWGDAAVICPWTLYLCYGDKELLVEQYDSMKAWVEYIRAQGENEYLWNTGFHFGDWLALDAKENSYIGSTPRDFIATAYFAYSTRILRDTAVTLGRAEDVRTYGDLLNAITSQFRDEFVTPTGRLASPTQTAHALALVFDLVKGSARERVAQELNTLVVDNNYHLTTGFVGTPYLCFALSDNGYHDTAVKLLLQESYPSWLYSVSQGATTIWEHWDSLKEDGSFWSDDMNSFNHYAYGAIGDWLYRRVAGLDMDESQPGYKLIRIHPRVESGELTYAKATLESMYGSILSQWTKDDRHITIEVQIPVNTSAEVQLPGAALEQVLVDQQPLQEVDGIQSIIENKNGVSLIVGSGRYTFEYPLQSIL